jgi:hypothetical protein
MCKACDIRGQTWIGQAPVCGFPDGIFNANNWNCATLNSLRDIAKRIGTVQGMNDCYIAIIPIIDEGWIILSWYKDRGKTSTARFMIDTVNISLDLCMAEKAIEQYKNNLEE